MVEMQQDGSLLRLEGAKRERVQALRTSLVDNLPGICSERARIYTQIYQDCGDDPPIVRRAKALRAYLQAVSLPFGPHDLIPGWQASRPRWAPIFPEYSWEWVFEELDRFEGRSFDRFQIPGAEKEELRQLLPWWKGRTLYESVLARQPQEVLQAAKIGAISWAGQAMSGEGHIVVDFRMALEQGFERLREEAALLLEGLHPDDQEYPSKAAFYQAAGMVCDGVLSYAQRLADRASRLADHEKDPSAPQNCTAWRLTCAYRRQSLPKPSGRLSYTIWLVHLVQQMESNGHSVSLGRLDQLLFPYYIPDIQSGRITARMLWNCWNIFT